MLLARRATCRWGLRAVGTDVGRPQANEPVVEFVGFAEWNRDGRLGHDVQDGAMDEACKREFGANCRAATWLEYEKNAIQNLPKNNDSDLWLHFTGREGWGLDNGMGYQWKRCIWREKKLNGGFTEDSCSASICSAAAVRPIRK